VVVKFKNVFAQKHLKISLQKRMLVVQKKQDLHQSAEFQAVKKSIAVSTISVFNFTSIVPSVVVKSTSIHLLSRKGLLFTGPPIYALDCLYLI
jgi:S-adenosylmethionine:tRNA-ribosyltransferase-isomerase (queuine synthetase)